jgi:D-serine deaminase-like pyridoxal phosphate-dependent protein
VTTPTLLLDETRVRRNIRRMVERAQRTGVRLRPHFKTHQSAEIGGWFRERGVSAITVSSLRMAEYFARAGWRDITVAFPLNVRELPTAERLAGQGVRLGLLVDSAEVVAAAGAALRQSVDLWLEVDSGQLRSGIPAAQVERFGALLQAAEGFALLRVRGLLTHSGQSYAARGAAELLALQAQTLQQLGELRSALSAHKAAHGRRLELSVGDTPICSIADSFGPADEIRPGNFVFYDWTQLEIGACGEEGIAVALAAPIVGIYPERREIALYAGAVHLSRDALPHASGGMDYGRVALPHEGGWGPALAGVHLRALSQEHGVLQADAAAWQAHLAQLRHGDLLCVLPVHSCLTADLMKEYWTVDGRRISMLRLENGAAAG